MIYIELLHQYTHRQAVTSWMLVNVAESHWLKFISILKTPLPVVICLHAKRRHGMRSAFFEAAIWNIFFWDIHWIFITTINRVIWIHNSILIVWCSSRIIDVGWIELWHGVWWIFELRKPTLSFLSVRRKFPIKFLIRVCYSRAIDKALSCLILEGS